MDLHITNANNPINACYMTLDFVNPPSTAAVVASSPPLSHLQMHYLDLFKMTPFKKRLSKESQRENGICVSMKGKRKL